MAANKIHSCDKEMVIKSMQIELGEVRRNQVKTSEELGNWKFFKKLFFVLVALGVGSIASAAITIPKFMYDMNTKAEVMSLGLKAIKEDSRKLSNEVQDIKELQKKELKHTKKSPDTDVLKEAIKEAILETKRSNRRNR